MTGTAEGEFTATMDDPDDPDMFERNRIHTNAGAQEYGFKGAFVGGVTLYAWCVPTVIDALGDARRLAAHPGKPLGRRRGRRVRLRQPGKTRRQRHRR